MIQASIADQENPIIILGLSEENVLRLKAGRPIRTPISSFGVNQPGQILVVYGQNEQMIFEDLKREGLVGRETEIHRDPKLDAQASIKRNYPHLLIATVGLPRSGKSTWAKSQGYPIVCPDAIRLALHGERFIYQAEGFVWEIAWKMIRSLFLAGHEKVILDSCSNTRKRREELLPKKFDATPYDLVFKVISTPAEACIERAKNDTVILPVIERMAAEHEPLGEGEVEWL